MTSALLHRLDAMPRVVTYGRVTRVVGLVIEATGLDVGLGTLCRIQSAASDRNLLAEVVGFHERGVLLMPLGEIDGLHPGCTVRPLSHGIGVQAGPCLLGRVLDGLGRPIDGKGPLVGCSQVSLTAEPPKALERQLVTKPLECGVRALDGMLTIGRGQRLGVFAGSGVGKSTLLGMIARHAEADVNVIALLGERGREVRDFIEGSLGAEGLARSVVIVATGDQAALVRARGALVATAIAEHFRDTGKHVMLMVDSVTRVAMAWREIGLAVGEPPTTKGYPPSVFAALPRLLERAGNGSTGGITGIYSVLVDGDDFNEPVADAARSILDGHVVLSRSLAASAHYPAIDVLESRSRVRDELIDAGHRRAANVVQRLIAAYQEKADLIAIGAYHRGADPLVDAALEHRELIQRFLQQPPDERSSLNDARRALLEIAERVSPHSHMAAA